MIKSMTGFGTAEGDVGRAHVSVEIRSVNHRFFNPSIKLPGSLSKWEGDVRETLRKGIARGHVTLFARLDRQATDEVLRIDEERFGAYVAQLRELQQKFGLVDKLDVGTVLRMPDVMSAREAEEEGTAAELVAIVEVAVRALDEMRKAEGRRLATYILERLSVIEEAVETIAARAPDRLTEQRDRMRATIEELAGGVALDEQRLSQEIAVLA